MGFGFKRPETNGAAQSVEAKAAPKVKSERGPVSPILKGLSRQTFNKGYAPKLKAKNEKRGEGPSDLNANLVSHEPAQYILRIDRMATENNGTEIFKTEVTIVDGDGDSAVGSKAEIAFWGGSVKKRAMMQQRILELACSVMNCPPTAEGIEVDGETFASIEEVVDAACTASQAFTGKHVVATVSYARGKDEMEKHPGYFPNFDNIKFSPIGFEGGEFVEVNDNRFEEG